MQESFYKSLNLSHWALNIKFNQNITTEFGGKNLSGFIY